MRLGSAIRNLIFDSPPVRQLSAAFHIMRTLWRRNFVKKETEIPFHVQTYARMCEASYQHPDDRSRNIDGNDYLHGLSSERVAVYLSDTEIILAIRGTVVSLSDLRNDVQILTGRNFTDDNPRIRDLIETARILDSHYGEQQLVLTGHSLGATIANTVADELKARAYMFNPGSSPYGSRVPCRLCHYWVVNTDAISISALSLVHNKQIYLIEKQKPDLSSHTIQQFT